MKFQLSLTAALGLFLMSCGGGNQPGNIPAASAPEISNGKKLFVNNCIVCHSLHEDKTGPKLAGVMSNWGNDTTLLTAYIKNSQQVIASGKNAHIVKVYHNFNEAMMPPFPNLTDADVKDIIDYINKGQE